MKRSRTQQGLYPESRMKKQSAVFLGQTIYRTGSDIQLSPGKD